MAYHWKHYITTRAEKNGISLLCETCAESWISLTNCHLNKLIHILNVTISKKLGHIVLNTNIKKKIALFIEINAICESIYMKDDFS